ncbi:MAG: SIS domain-containing protein [Bifidobacteriaceae bacterium]|jgi:6-phospho-3-hexuloisomerase|nr:SIS domain-containing protein [Bifidobacteriaceae bacterium]
MTALGPFDGQHQPEGDIRHQADQYMVVAAEIAQVLTRINQSSYTTFKQDLADKSRSWFFTGQGRSGLVAAMAAMRLMHIGRQSHVVGEPTCPAIRRGDGIVLLSGSGQTLTTVSFANLAGLAGARVLALTAEPDSPLARAANTVLAIPVGQSNQIGRNLFEQAALIVLDALIGDLASELDDAAALLAERHTNLQ